MCMCMLGGGGEEYRESDMEVIELIITFPPSLQHLCYQHTSLSCSVERLQKVVKVSHAESKSGVLLFLGHSPLVLSLCNCLDSFTGNSQQTSTLPDSQLS